MPQDPVYTLSIKPSPLRSGGTGEIKYDGPTGTVITLDWGDITVTVTIDSNGKASFTVPNGAQSLIASDPWGNEASSTVSP